MKIKYPRTPHLPWSPGASSDDIHHKHSDHFVGKQVIITEKMDGENTTLYRNAIHARSLDSRYHTSRAWVKALQARIGYQIPENWRICGENLFAQHSIAYQTLESYFLAFSIWNAQNMCLAWDETIEICNQLGLSTPAVLYQGIWCEKSIRTLVINTQQQEGYVVRIADRFHFDDFSTCVAKWVRTNHVMTNQHWMHSEVVPNQLASQSGKKEEPNG